MYIDTGKIYPCPCCGFLVYTLEPGSDQVCPICLWQDNLAQLRFPLMPNVANNVSLVDAQLNYINCGAAEKRNTKKTRKPFDTEMLDKGWRPLDSDIDNIEEPMRGIKDTLIN